MTRTLRERRVAAGLSQQELAAKARCSIGSVRLYEGGFTPSQSGALVLGRIVAVLERVEAQMDTAA